MDENESDESLMLRYRDGDAAAFDTLYARHRGALYRFIRRSIGANGQGDEIFQDVWLNLIQARTRYVASAKFSTWLYTLAHHRLIDHFRATSRAEFASFAEDDDNPVIQLPAARTEEPEVRVLARQQGERLASAVAALPAVQRETLLLRLDGDLSVEQIAAATGASFETAKSRLRYALAKVRGALSEFAPDAQSPVIARPASVGEES